MYEIFEKLLRKRHTTAYRVAKDTGVTTATLSSWKQGKYTPKLEKLQKIADYFGVSPDYLQGNSYIKDLGGVIKEERERLRITRDDVAEYARISASDLERYEEQGAPIREDIAEDIADALGTTVPELLHDNCLFDEYIPPQFQSAKRYTDFQSAQRNDAMTEAAQELAQFAILNPEYKVLFDATRKTKPEDIEFLASVINRVNGRE